MIVVLKPKLFCLTCHLDSAAELSMVCKKHSLRRDLILQKGVFHRDEIPQSLYHPACSKIRRLLRIDSYEGGLNSDNPSSE